MKIFLIKKYPKYLFDSKSFVPRLWSVESTKRQDNEGIQFLVKSWLFSRGPIQTLLWFELNHGNLIYHN